MKAPLPNREKEKAGRGAISRDDLRGGTVGNAHKFKLGQSVEFIAGPLHPKPLGSFKVVRIMPRERGVLQYRLKSVLDGHERMALETELADRLFE
jgi:hypothetical protein